MLRLHSTSFSPQAKTGLLGLLGLLGQLPIVSLSLDRLVAVVDSMPFVYWISFRLAAAAADFRFFFSLVSS
jgi:hypothetical protein